MPVKRGLRFGEKKGESGRAYKDVPNPVQTNTSPTQLGACPRTSPNGSPNNPDEEDTKENYGLEKIQTEMEQCRADPSIKPDLSYIALIGLAIQSSQDKQTPLSDIYDWISSHFPYFDPDDRSWRNSVRHNLSLNECFIKAVKSDGSKSSNWIIHPANVEDFEAGDFRRRRARRKVRQAESKKADENENTNIEADTFVPMTVTTASADELIKLFGKEAIMGDPEKIATLQMYPQCTSFDTTSAAAGVSPNQIQVIYSDERYVNNGIQNVDIVSAHQHEMSVDVQTANSIQHDYQPEYVETSVQQLSQLQNQGTQNQMTVDQSALESGLAILSEALCMGEEDMDMEGDETDMLNMSFNFSEYCASESPGHEGN